MLCMIFELPGVMSFDLPKFHFLLSVKWKKTAVLNSQAALRTNMEYTNLSITNY